MNAGYRQSRSGLAGKMSGGTTIEASLDEADIYFDEYLSEWLEKTAHYLEKSTYSGYCYKVRIIVDFFKDKRIRLSELSVRDLNEFYDYLRYERSWGGQTGLKEKTIKRYHANIHRCLSDAEAEGLIARNPADAIRRFHLESEFVPNYCNAVQISQVIHIFEEDPLFFVVLTGAYYGLRKSEILGLKWSSIDFINESITIRNVVVDLPGGGSPRHILKENPKNKSSYRTLPLFPVIKKKLLEMKEEKKHNELKYGSRYEHRYDDYICVKANGELIKSNYISQHFRAVMDHHPELPRLRFHDLRHSCATILLNNGVELERIGKWLGHSSSVTTERYAHADFSRHISVGKVIEGCISACMEDEEKEEDRETG